MRILWVVNFVFPDVAEKLNIPKNISGGWLLDLARQIADLPDYKLTIVSMYGGSDLIEFNLNNIQYFCIPGGGKKARMYSKYSIKNGSIMLLLLCGDSLLEDL